MLHVQYLLQIMLQFVKLEHNNQAVLVQQKFLYKLQPIQQHVQQLILLKFMNKLHIHIYIQYKLLAMQILNLVIKKHQQVLPQHLIQLFQHKLHFLEVAFMLVVLLLKMQFINQLLQQILQNKLHHVQITFNKLLIMMELLQ